MAVQLDTRLFEILAPLPQSRREYLISRIGVAPWQVRSARLDMRNAALADLAARHFPKMSCRSQAAAISATWRAMAYRPETGSIPPRDCDDERDAIRRVADLSAPGKFPGERHIARLLIAYGSKQ